MGIIPDELKRETFPCPTCGQIISTDAESCRFCSLEITEARKAVSVSNELRERSLVRLRNHKFYMGAGVAVFGAGLFTLLSPVLGSMMGSGAVTFSCWTPLLIFGGLGAFIMGLSGYFREKSYLRNV
jgi:hypothetical protein